MTTLQLPITCYGATFGNSPVLCYAVLKRHQFLAPFAWAKGELETTPSTGLESHRRNLVRSWLQIHPPPKKTQITTVFCTLLLLPSRLQMAPMVGGPAMMGSPSPGQPYSSGAYGYAPAYPAAPPATAYPAGPGGGPMQQQQQQMGGYPPNSSGTYGPPQQPYDSNVPVHRY